MGEDKSYRELIGSCGYVCMSQNVNRISFNKGYTENGFAERVFHLHLRYMGDNDELYFRNYLIEHRETAVEYECVSTLGFGEEIRDEYDRTSEN